MKTKCFKSSSTNHRRTCNYSKWLIDWFLSQRSNTIVRICLIYDFTIVCIFDTELWMKPKQICICLECWHFSFVILQVGEIIFLILLIISFIGVLYESKERDFGKFSCKLQISMNSLIAMNEIIFAKLFETSFVLIEDLW